MYAVQQAQSLRSLSRYCLLGRPMLNEMRWLACHVSMDRSSLASQSGACG